MSRAPRGRRPLRTLTDLRPDPANARAHGQRNVEMIAAALDEVGAARSIVIDEDGTVLAGNATIEAAKARGLTRLQVVDADGQTVVAVRRRGLTPQQKTRLALYDNRTAELATWDPEALDRLVADGVSLDGLWSSEELAALMAGVDADQTATRAGLTDPDEVPVAPTTTDIRPGDLFELGQHRLLCGDSTNAQDVGRVMGEERAVLLNTDPPYGVDYAAVKNGIPGSGFRDIQARGGDIRNDDLTTGPALQAFLESMIRVAAPHLSPMCAFYLWHPMLTQGTFFAAAAAADILIHRQIIWVKPGFVLTRSGMYHWKHELCFFGWVRGHQPPWYGEKNQVSVWECGRDDDAGQHPTQKPAELFRRPIQNHCRAGDVIYEPFAGSGSQLIAAEQLNVSCRAIEVEPRYVHVAISRFERFTGQKARKVGEAVR